MSNPVVAFLRDRQIRPFLIGWCLCLIALEAYGIVFLGGDLAAHPPFDFQFFYVVEYLARTTPSHMYDVARQTQLGWSLAFDRFWVPFYHPSYELFLLSPLSLLSFRASYYATIAFNMLLLVPAFFVSRKAFSTAIPLLQPRPGLIFFVFVPLLNAVILGQDSILSLLLYCLTWRELEAGRDRNAGFFLALALFKFQIVLPVAALLAIRKGWRFTGAFLVTAAAIALFSVYLVGLPGTADYVRLCLDAGATIGKGRVAFLRSGIYPLAMPNFTGLLYACGGQLLHSALGFNVLRGIVALAVFAWSAWTVRRAELKVAFSIAVLCALMISVHLFIYDLTLALLPIALLGNRVNRYVLLGLFGLPLILGHIGSDPYFVMAVPMLWILGSVLIRESRVEPGDQVQFLDPSPDSSLA